jgi:hypothetical protein
MSMDANVPQTTPDKSSAYGAAWKIDMDSIRADHPDKVDSTVAAWIVFAPWAHPAWCCYAIMAIHLRPTDGLKDPVIRLPTATHEVWVYALDPDREPDLRNPIKTYLTPANFVGQWTSQVRRNPVDLDRDAARKIELHIDEILAGELSPDTDFIQEWVVRFSDSNLRR